MQHDEPIVSGIECAHLGQKEGRQVLNRLPQNFGRLINARLSFSVVMKESERFLN